MNAYATPGDSFGQRMEALWEHVEDEFHHAVGYVDRVIVPEARREAGIGCADSGALPRSACGPA